MCNLAEFQKASDRVRTSLEQIVETMFGDNPQVWAELVEDEDGVQGMALWFVTYSTWEGSYGIHMEDLLSVRKHVGKAMRHFSFNG